jgi:hypothetical protein
MFTLLTAFSLSGLNTTARAEMLWISVADNKTHFVAGTKHTPFKPWGFNYDHDPTGRLIEDYWTDEWSTVERDFAMMKKLGANVVRVHLQFGCFMDTRDKPNKKALEKLDALLKLAERERLYLDLTGLGCYHKADVPAWYDALSERERWDAQAQFWTAVASRCKNSPAVFCYDLMNEPVVPGGKRKDGDWLGPAFGNKHFVQFITLDQEKRPRHEIAQAWIKHLTTAIRKVDPRHLITVGLVHWSLDRPGLKSGFLPDKIAPELDFLAVHIYPERGKLDEARDTLKAFNVGKPVIVEETFPLKCSSKELEEFIDSNKMDSAGWISFYWGKPPEELRKSNTIGDAILLDWLTRFEARASRDKK